MSAGRASSGNGTAPGLPAPGGVRRRATALAVAGPPTPVRTIAASTIGTGPAPGMKIESKGISTIPTVAAKSHATSIAPSLDPAMRDEPPETAYLSSRSRGSATR